MPTEQIPAIGDKKSNKLKAVLVALGLAAIATLGFFAFGGSAGAANLKYVFTAGETHRYQLSMTMKVAGGNLDGAATFEGTVEMILRQVVRDVDDNGTATLEYRIDRATLIEGGRTQQVPIPIDVVTCKMTSDGTVIELQGGALSGLKKINPGAGVLGPESFGPILADYKVDPGESWKLDEEFPNPFGDPFHLVGKVTLVERNVIAGQPGAVIRTEIKSPMDFKMELAKLADIIGEDLPEQLKKAAMTFQGYLNMNITQSVTTRTGDMRSAVGEMTMTGTYTTFNFPEGDETGVLNMSVQLTLTELI